MPLYRTQALVLRSMNLGDADKLVTLFTRDFGKVKVVAKAARRIKSRFGACLEPMTHLSLIYFGKEHQDLYRLNQCDIVRSFQKVREHPQKFYTGIYFVELSESLIGEAHPEIPIFDLLANALAKVEGPGDLETLCRLYEMRIMALAGYTPRLRHCIQCRKEPQSRWVGFSYTRHGILCESCQEQTVLEVRIQNGTLNYLRKLLTLDIQHADRLKIPKGSEDEIESITHRLILARLGRELKSYPFIKTMAV
ncbi:DNA repair protein RecO [Nitrospina watsonii]|uniref:DNA repair protein RecO n=1 Tax=Nitrospina watsonii TaxID=1323948 RepID=A0ABN8W2A7_9BACT|nr:DNA repair protein RecO [Nitrospina watsonii]CAI2718221.1 DNA repair protein RecO [Nitrospina watsonii]